ncbi:MAG: hypothetical protein JJU18_01335 [Oceanicaulis sp.]|nr:hypothetical protein [Oceanicaulis sp.]
MNPTTIPATAVSCAGSGWRNAVRVRPVYPVDLMIFLYVRQDRSDLRSLEFSFDIDETGSTANIRFLEPSSYTRHGTMRQAVLAAAEAIEKWRYEMDGEAVYATACRTQIDFSYELETRV